MSRAGRDSEEAVAAAASEFIVPSPTGNGATGSGSMSTLQFDMEKPAEGDELMVPLPMSVPASPEPSGPGLSEAKGVRQRVPPVRMRPKQRSGFSMPGAGAQVAGRTLMTSVISSPEELAAIYKSLVILETALIVGALIIGRLEEWDVVEAFEWSVATVTTVGYGDLAPTKDSTKALTMLYAMIGVGVVGFAFQQIQTLVLADLENLLLQRTVQTPKICGISSKLWVNFGAICAMLCAATVTFWLLEDDWNGVESLYFAAVTLSTIGYGDFHPKAKDSRLVASFYMLLSLLLFAFSISNIVTELSKINTARLEQEIGALKALRTPRAGRRRGPQTPGSGAAAPQTPVSSSALVSPSGVSGIVSPSTIEPLTATKPIVLPPSVSRSLLDVPVIRDATPDDEPGDSAVPPPPAKKASPRSRSVRRAISRVIVFLRRYSTYLVFLLLWLASAGLYSGVEDVSFLDGLYVIIVTATTVGYGDMAPTRTGMRLFWVPFSVLIVALVGVMISDLQAKLIEKQVHKVVKAVEEAVEEAVADSESPSAAEVRARKEEEKKEKKKKKGPSFRRKVLPALVMLFVGVGLGAMAMALIEEWRYYDAVYFIVITVTTIGYGDFFPTTTGGKWCAVVGIPLFLVSLGYCLSAVTNHLTKTKRKAQAQRVSRELSRAESVLLSQLQNIRSRSRAKGPSSPIGGFFKRTSPSIQLQAPPAVAAAV